MLERFRMLIGGKAVEAISGRTFESENPYTGQPWAAIPDGGPQDVDAAVQAARAARGGAGGAMTGFGRARRRRLLGARPAARRPPTPRARRPGPRWTVSGAR